MRHLNLSRPSFSPLGSGNNGTQLTQVVGGFNKLRYAKCPGQCQTHSRGSVECHQHGVITRVTGAQAGGHHSGASRHLGCGSSWEGANND